MSFLDKAKDALDKALDKTTLDEKAQDAYTEHGDTIRDGVDQHADRIDQGIDRAGDFIDDRTGGRFGEQIDAGGDTLRERLDGLDGKQDDFGTVDPTIDPAEEPPCVGQGSAGSVPSTS